LLIGDAHFAADIALDQAGRQDLLALEIAVHVAQLGLRDSLLLQFLPILFFATHVFLDGGDRFVDGIAQFVVGDLETLGFGLRDQELVRNHRFEDVPEQLLLVFLVESPDVALHSNQVHLLQDFREQNRLVVHRGDDSIDEFATGPGGWHSEAERHGGEDDEHNS
jgi:hypothetical protein